jgi:pyrimidine-nucleoside phosphorylase/thymidine phosphorylase
MSLTAAGLRAAIARKRDGASLEPELWSQIVAGHVGGALDDAQVAAFLMACFVRGLDAEETEALTRAMVASGETLPPAAPGCVDKHSTGGVGDAVSLIVVPLVAACGVPVAKLSGGALGHTGGTLDKLRAVPGLRVDLSPERFAAQVREVGCAIAAPGPRLSPADAGLYALRDRTATVASLGLVAASIVSKKIAGGAPAIVYDVKLGRGALFPDALQARTLAETLVRLSETFGRRAYALGSDMDEPLGTAIGTGLEVLEARAYLRDERRDARLAAVCERVAAEMLRAGGFTGDPQSALDAALGGGEAYERFERMLAAQGAVSDWATQLVPHPRTRAVAATRSGFIAEIDTVALGEIARELTERDGSGAGLHVAVRSGDAIEPGRTLATIFGEDDSADHVASAFAISEKQPPARPLIYFEIGAV